MATAVDDPKVDTPPVEALELHEAASVAPGSIFDEQGRVPIHVIRPGVGKGRGRHLYEAEMLRENAHKFAGWRMYIDHLSPEARKAAGGLPRSIRDLGGRVDESYWDPTVPADPDRGYGQGAVVGMAKPTPFVRELIENDPAIIEASISASATGVRPVVRNGQKVWLVEGINDRGSVDWVTEGGAGGRVAPLLEAYASDEEAEKVLLEQMTDDEVRAYLAEHRPAMLAEAKKSDTDEPGDAAEDAGDKGKDELEEEIQKFLKKGLPRKLAEKAARRSLAKETQEGRTSDPEGGAVSDITAESLQEALQEQPNLLVEALQQSEEASDFIAGLVETKLDEKVEAEVEKRLTESRDEIFAEARGEAQREVQLARMEVAAHKQISESKLPDTWQEGLREKFSLSEAGKPTDALDVTDEVDDDGKVTKPAAQALREAVEAEIARERERLAEVAPTRVRGQGPAAPSEGEGEVEEGKKKEGPKPFWKTTLEEAGVDADKAYTEA